MGLAAALAPTREPALHALALRDRGEHLDPAAALAGGAEADEVELARVGHPGSPVQRALVVLAPPQPDVELARGEATLIGCVEARERWVVRERRSQAPAVFSSHEENTSFRR